jgi:hypothetical protein
MSAKGYGLFLIGIAAYLFWLQRVIQPRFQVVNGVFAGWLLVVGLLLWFRFRWSPELYLASCLLMISEPVALIALEGYNTRRLVMILGAVIAAMAYPDLRRQLRGKIVPRGKMVSDLEDDL